VGFFSICACVQDFDLALPAEDEDAAADCKRPLPTASALERADEILTRQDTTIQFKTFMRNSDNATRMRDVVTILFDHYTHSNVVALLESRWNIQVSEKGLRDRCKTWGLKKTEHVDEALLLRLVEEVATDNRHAFGYRAVRHIIRQRYGVRVSQAAVRFAMKLAFPEETLERTKNTLHRREYNGSHPRCFVTSKCMLVVSMKDYTTMCCPCSSSWRQVRLAH
jgi:hypothetical protein